MARKTTDRDFSPILDAAQQWITRCIIHDGSVFSNRPLWSLKNLQELHTRFVKAPDTTKRDFLVKLRDQLSAASPEARSLMAEVLWVLSLFPSKRNMLPQTKRARVIEFWSGSNSPENHAELRDAVLEGIGSVGQGYMQHQPLEAEYIITTILALKEGDQNRAAIFQTPDKLDDWLSNQKSATKRQFPNILRYFAFPDEVERISSEPNKREILKAYGISVQPHWPHKRLDEELLTLRKKLEQQYPNKKLDFYESPLVEKWKIQESAGLGKPDTDENGNLEESDHGRLLKPDSPTINRIYFGPPGTGKTYELQRIRERYIEVPEAKDRNAWLEAIVADFGWRAVIAATLNDLGPCAVPKIRDHELIQAMTRQRKNGLNLGQKIWGALQRHTPENVGTVKFGLRTAPFIFTKDTESVWSLLPDWEANDEEAAQLAARFKAGQKAAPPISRYRTVTFHPSYCYEDFVRGIRPVSTEEDGRTEFRLVDGVFKQICEEARANPTKRYALFIDEINRGNIAKIFGELITLIEPDKRIKVAADGTVTGGMTVQLPGSNTGEVSEPPFGVPGNLDIYGTMNTADRSIALLDIALRRRFEFVEMPPLTDASVFPASVDGVDRGALLLRINDRLEYLLDRDHRIGHAYLMKAQSLTGLRSAFANQIIPLLQEYFFDDLGKVALVLAGPNGRSQFVDKKELRHADLFPGNISRSTAATRQRYEVTDSGTWTAEHFQGIYATAPAVESNDDEAAS